MIDNFALALTHGLLALAFWRLLQRDDLDSEDPAGRDAGAAAPPPPPATVQPVEHRFKLPPKGAPRA